MGAVRMRVLLKHHSTPVHQLTSGEDKTETNPTLRHFSCLKYESIIHNNSSSVKKCSGLNQERNLHRCQNSSKQTCDWIFYVRDNMRCTFSLEEELLCIIDSYFRH